MLVLDSAPPELVRTTSYLQRQTEGRITLDLITIASYSVGGTEIVVPQRVDGDAPALDASRPSAMSVRRGELSEGAEVFEDSIASAPVEEQARLRELCAWARGLEAEGVVRLESFRGIANRWVLLLRLAPTSLPEGAEVVLLPIDGEDDLDDDERAALHESLRESIQQARAGDLIDGEQLIADLRRGT